jgi:hypothetical protein
MRGHMWRTRSLAIIGATGLAALAGGLLASQISGSHAKNSQPRNHRAAHVRQPAASHVGQPAASRARVITASAVRTTIAIDPHVGTTFAPPPANVSAAALTAQQAWAQFIQSSTTGSGGTAIPSTVTAQLGLFTLPIGPDCGPTCSGDPIQNGIAYKALNQLAYGYSWDGGTCGGSNPVNPAPPVPCTEWLFIDANTGHMTAWTVQLQPATK